MAEQPAAGEQRGGSMDTELGLLIQQELEPDFPNISRHPLPWEDPSLSLAATAVPASGGGKKPGYYSENGYLMELSRQERRRILREINQRYKPGESLYLGQEKGS